MSRYGNDVLEFFIDCCLSLENLVDPHYPFLENAHDDRDDAEWKGAPWQGPGRMSPGKLGKTHVVAPIPRGARRGRTTSATRKMSASGRSTSPARVIWTPTWIQRLLEARADEMKSAQATKKRFPNPDPDVLLFLIEHAPLKNWQRDVLSIVREEAYLAGAGARS